MNCEFKEKGKNLCNETNQIQIQLNIIFTSHEARELGLRKKPLQEQLTPWSFRGDMA